MANAQLHGVLRHLQGLRDAQAVTEAPDAELLEWFARANEEAPFTALVRRHGPMVWGVARRVLPHIHDAEDVFQATFLLLARKAASVRKAGSVGSFLHGVAHRLALKLRLQQARRQARERRAADMRQTRPGGETSLSEVQAALDAALAKLPEKYRAALVLCYLEGKTQEEAARHLGCPLATLRTRVARGRKLLRDRLAKGGLTLSAAGLAALLIAGAAPAAPPAALARVAARAAVPFAAGQPAAALCSAQAAGLVAGGLRMMFLTKAKTATALLLAAGLVAGAAALMQHLTAAGQAAEPAAATSPKPPAADEQGDRVEVSGQVVDPDGKPVAGAKVVFQQRGTKGELPGFLPEPATGTTDTDGRFRFSGSVHRNAPVRDRRPVLTLTAHVPGYGPAATADASSPDELRDRTLRLVKDDVPIRGRILGLEGKPIPGVTVRPVSVVGNPANDLGPVVRAIETNTWGDLPSEQRTYIVFSAAAAGLTQKAETDAEGRFTLSGFGRERIVALRLDGPTIETCLLNVMTRTGPAVQATRPRTGGLAPPGPPRSATYVYAYGATFDYAPGPGVVVEGAVRDQDSGKPLAGVAVHQGIDFDFGWAEGELTATTDAGGNYRLAGVARSSPRGYYHAIEFVPPAGQPYLTAAFRPPTAEPGNPTRLDVRLKRGVLVKGRVTDRATGRPVQAVVDYFAFADNPSLRGVEGFRGSEVVSSREDGSFALAALPGRGIVAVKTDDMRRGTYLSGRGADAIPGLNARRGNFETEPLPPVPGPVRYRRRDRTGRERRLGRMRPAARPREAGEGNRP
jgi:RNA polymerase sigma factor (sigma-70 family)